MNDARAQLLDWLRNAHAMEVQSEEMLKTHIRRLHHYPQLRDRIVSHLAETCEQQARLERCLREMGGEPSGLREFSARFLALGQGLLQVASTDEVVKSLVLTYSFESMEAVVYRTLATAAEVAGQPEIAGVCEEILRQEEGMAEWLREHLPDIVRQYLVRLELPGIQAKR
jgi:ferritin-like metal-binding protein YciE